MPYCAFFRKQQICFIRGVIFRQIDDTPKVPIHRDLSSVLRTHHAGAFADPDNLKIVFGWQGQIFVVKHIGIPVCAKEIQFKTDSQYYLFLVF